MQLLIEIYSKQKHKIATHPLHIDIIEDFHDMKYLKFLMKKQNFITIISNWKRQFMNNKLKYSSTENICMEI